MTEEGSRKDLAGLEVALQWAMLPPDHLKVALESLELELARQHELRVLHAKIRAQAEKDHRNYILYVCGLISGFIIVLSMLGASVIVGVNGLPWLSAMLAGPSLLSLAVLFVLRRADTVSANRASYADDEILNAVAPHRSGHAPRSQ